MKGLKSENVDIAFILQQKLIPPPKKKEEETKNKIYIYKKEHIKVQGITTVIHGWDIKVLSPTQVFLKIVNLT